MGGGIFNVHHAAQAITHAASSAGHKALELNQVRNASSTPNGCITT